MNAESEKEVEELTAEANYARARLLRTVEAIERKGHEALDVRLQVKRHKLAIGVAGSIVFAGIASTVATVTYRLVTIDQRRRRERFSALRRMWRHPERAARTSPPLLVQLGRSILLGVASALVLTPAKKLIARLFDAVMSPPPPRLGPTATAEKLVGAHPRTVLDTGIR